MIKYQTKHHTIVENVERQEKIRSSHYELGVTDFLPRIFETIFLTLPDLRYFVGLDDDVISFSSSIILLFSSFMEISFLS